MLGFELYFAYQSAQWDYGGVAFVGVQSVTPPPTLGRAYLLTLGQLRHVAVEENGGRGSVTITRENLVGAPVNIRDRGWYRVLLPCGLLDGIPVATLTGLPEEVIPRSTPSEIYLETIKAGLRETYPYMSDSDINGYLQQASAPESP
jgi:hypothetical protein